MIAQLAVRMPQICKAEFQRPSVFSLCISSHLNPLSRSVTHTYAHTKYHNYATNATQQETRRGLGVDRKLVALARVTGLGLKYVHIFNLFNLPEQQYNKGNSIFIKTCMDLTVHAGVLADSFHHFIQRLICLSSIC